MYRCSSWTLIVAVLFVSTAGAQLDHVSYQGALLDGGVPFNGNASFKFAIVAASGASLWSHDGTSSNGSEPTSSVVLSVDRGVFSVLLGRGMVALAAPALANATDPALRVWVDVGSGFVQLGDQLLSGAAFALQSDTAKRALGNFQVQGELQLSSGIRFPDDSVQTSASSGSDSWIVAGNTMHSTISGAVGIGTATPLDRLHIEGTENFLRLNSQPADQGSSGIRLMEGGTSRWTFLYRNWQSDNLHLRDEMAGSDVMTFQAGTRRIGIGNTDPRVRLDVGDVVRVGGTTFPTTGKGLELAYSPTLHRAYLQCYDRDAAQWGQLYLGDGKVGAGVLDPQASLHVKGQNWNLATTEGDFKIGNSNYRMKMGVAVNGGGAGDSYIHAQGGSHRLLLGSNGQNKLIVRESGVEVTNGTLTTPIITITGGADIAEPFPTSELASIDPGCVLVIDTDHAGRLTLSSTPYDTRVAGVVSGAGGVRPGLTLDQAAGGLDEFRGESERHVALTGRVYVKASAVNGPIRPGDLLTSSELAGHAMRASDRERWPGAVLGKAMTSLESGTGLVLALVNLQ